MKLKVIPNNEFFINVENIIRSGQTLELKVKGISMHPTLKNGKHRVVLAPFKPEEIRIGMIALFRYNGRHVLHRLVAIEGEKLIFQGDNLPYTKEVAKLENVIASVESIITSKGRIIGCGTRWYRLKSRLLVKVNRPRIILKNKTQGLWNRITKLTKATKTVGDGNGRVKVLFFIESLAGGGAERVLATIVSHIDKDRFDVTVSSIVSGGVYAEQVSDAVRYRPVIKNRKSIFYKPTYHLIYFRLPLRWVYKLFVPKGNDIEIAFCEGFATKLLANSSAKRKIAWIHTDMIENPWTQESVFTSVEEEKQAYAKYDDVICVSDTVSECFKQKFGLDAQTLYNPIDSDTIVDRAKERTDLPAKTRTRFVTTGRLVEQKGYDRLVKVAKKLNDAGCDFEIWILGDGVERDSLTAYIEQNHLEENVKILGFKPNPFPYIASGDVFVCSSRCEGFSTAATEAIIMGMPVITTLCSGMTELLGENDEYGLIVENEDMSLFEPMKKVIEQPDFLDELKLKAARRGGDFNIENLIKPIEKLLG